MGSRWRVGLGSEGHELAFTARRPWPDLSVVDLDQAVSVLVIVERIGTAVVMQSTLATVTDGPEGAGTVVLTELAAAYPGYHNVRGVVTMGDGEVVVVSLGTLNVTGRRTVSATNHPPLDTAGAPFAVHVTQWTPAGDQVVEVHILGPDFVPQGEPSYLWDDPADSTTALVAWPGNPATLLDEKP